MWLARKETCEMFAPLYLWFEVVILPNPARVLLDEPTALACVF